MDYIKLRCTHRAQGQIQGGVVPPGTYKSNSFHHDFVQFRKQHSRYATYCSPLFYHSSIV